MQQRHLPVRHLAASLALVSLVALASAIVLASSQTPAQPPAWIAADDAARSRGVHRFEVVTEAPGVLDVRLEGPAVAGRLRVHADATETEQRIEGFGEPFVVRTRRDSLAVGRPGAERIIAHRGRGSWDGAPLDAADADALARVLAIDVSVAVQGSSLVFGGTGYVSCTVRCTRAETCVRRMSQPAGCADDIVVCGACLEREL